MRMCRSIVWAVLSFALVELMVSCGKESSSTDMLSYDVTGEWALQCIEVVLEGESERQSHSFVFKSGTFTEELTIYAATDTKCSTPLETHEMSGDYTTEKSTDGGPYDINLAYTQVSVTVFDANTLSFFNGKESGSTAICGGNWQKGVARTLDKNSCATNSSTLPLAGMTLYDLYEVRNEQLRFGLRDEGIPSAKSKRPVSIDTAQEFPRDDQGTTVTLQ